ncbi:polyketide cyclase/dehydrase and lipid transport domain-containing protein [Ceratobasidium sp. AG-Ba]|nr:polyketide cyclase/dehydrase and lipid transport domain-containing protein [Ceratobasidium sp. AG-Ba]
MTALRSAAARLPQRRSLFSLPNLPSAGPSKSTFRTRKILPYTQRQLYNLVADVDSYHRFLPFCTGSKVLTPTPKEGFDIGKPYQVEAELSVGFMSVSESYTSIVTFRPYEFVQAVASSSTPLFKSLETIWRFQPASASSPHPSSSPPPRASSHGQGIDVGPALLSIDLEYEFANPLHAAIASGSFGRVSDMMVQAFERRCVEVYGKGKA